MLEIELLIERVEGVRLSEKASENLPSNYGLNVSMAEKDRNPEALTLSFSLELTDQPQVARMVVSGIATLTGTTDEIQGATKAPDGSTPPPILVVIYERIYGLLYLVSGNLKIPHPMPNLLKAGGPEKK